MYGTVRFSSTKYRTAYGIKNRPPYRTEPYENRRYGIYRSTVRSSTQAATPDRLDVENDLQQELDLDTAIPAARPVSHTGALPQVDSGTTTIKRRAWIKEQEDLTD